MKKYLGIIYIAAALALSVACWWILPADVAVQIGVSGKASNFLPKLVAILIPLVITAVGAVLDRKAAGNGRIKTTILSLAGIVMLSAELLLN